MTVDYVKYYDGDFFAKDYLVRGVDTTGYTAEGGSVYCNTIGAAALGDAGDAVEMKLTTTIDTTTLNDQAVTIIIPDADGNRIYMQIHDTGAWISHNDSNTYGFTADQVAKIRNTDATLLYINDGNTFSLYVKEIDGNWLLLVTTTGKRSGGNRANLSVGASGGAKCDIDYIKYIDAEGLADSDAKAEDCFKVYEQEFDTAEIKGDNTSTDDVVCKDGVLRLPENGEISFNGAPIPLGGYAESKCFMVKNSKALTLSLMS